MACVKNSFAEILKSFLLSTRHIVGNMQILLLFVCISKEYVELNSDLLQALVSYIHPSHIGSRVRPIKLDLWLDQIWAEREQQLCVSITFSFSIVLAISPLSLEALYLTPSSSTSSLAAVLWCSGSHIYGVSEGQWGLLPGTARSCLCRRVNSRTHLLSEHIGPTGGGSETLAGSGHLLTYQQNEPGWGNSTCCTLPSLASAWSESRGNLSCFPKGEGV